VFLEEAFTVISKHRLLIFIICIPKWIWCHVPKVFREQIRGFHDLLGRLHLAQSLSAKDMDLINRIMTEKVLRIADDVRVRHCRKFLYLHNGQHPPGLPDNKRTIINLCKVALEEACSTLSKSLNYVVAHGLLTIKDMLYGKEKAVGILPEETAEKILLEMVGILNGSHLPKDNLTCASRRALVL
jgi:hypothetical protein